MPGHNCVPAHKRLENAPPGTGLPIGNLTSQFFANLYLNELDQFVKHQLHCRHYVRYVDDFVLLHRDREQLVRWREEIAGFIAQRLRLGLKAASNPAPLTNGADFLGYIVRPGYRLVRRRVVGNLHERLSVMERELLRSSRGGLLFSLPRERRERLLAILASYWGHFCHADSYRLRQKIFTAFPWLTLFFRDPIALHHRWQPNRVSSLVSQWRYFEQEFPGYLLLLQCGRQLLCNAELPGLTLYQGLARLKAWSAPIRVLPTIQARLRRYRCSYLFCAEEGYLHGGLKRRVLRLLWLNPNDSRIGGGQISNLSPLSS